MNWRTYLAVIFLMVLAVALGGFISGALRAIAEGA
jgi:hypothetical protein